MDKVSVGQTRAMTASRTLEGYEPEETGVKHSQDNQGNDNCAAVYAL